MPRRSKKAEDKARQDQIDIDAIIEKIDAQELAEKPLFDRMDEDTSQWRNDPFLPSGDEGIEPEDAYTSNAQHTLVSLGVTILSNAARLIRIFNDSEKDEPRDANNNAERLAIGFYEMADQRYRNLTGVGIQEALSLFSVLRGGHISARAVLMKDSAGNTIPDITPFDPRHFVGMSDADGFIWIAIIDQRQRRQILEQFPDFEFNEESKNLENNAGSDVFRFIDTYIRKPLARANRHGAKFQYFNGVIVDKQWAKEPTKIANAIDPPVPVRANGGNPGLGNFTLKSSNTNNREIAGIRDYSESILAANRLVNNTINRSATYLQKLAALRAQGVYTLMSRHGDAAVEMNPNDKNQVINLSREDQQELKLLEIADAATAGEQALLGIAAADQARGSVGEANQGPLKSGISGRALRIANRAKRDLLIPHESAVSSVLTAALEALVKQYQTGGFRPIRVSGIDRSLEGFNTEITPEDIEGRGPIHLKLLPQLPEDEEANVQQAILLSQAGASGQPIFDNRTILDRVLNVQDSDIIERRVFAQMSRTSTPMMLAISQLEAAEERGDDESVAFFSDEIKNLLEERQMQQFARKVAFAGLISQSGVQAAADGVQDGGGGGGGGQGTPRNPASGMQPETMPLSGTLLGGVPFRTDPEAQDVFARSGLVIAER